MTIGKVLLVGAGPGDPELLTLKAARAIACAETVVYDRLVPAEIVRLAPTSAVRVDVGKQAGHHPVPQAEINRLLIQFARSGHNVVRLKGGDPFIFGRGCEEALALEQAEIPFEVIPGITAAQGCAAAARVPLTHRGLATGVRYVTGHCRGDEPLDLDWASLADPGTTLVVYMGFANIGEIVRQLVVHGLPGDTPVLAVCQGTTPREQRICASLMSLPRAVRAANFEGPILFIIGRVAAIAAEWKEHDAMVRHDTAAVA
jgi:uroporphyrin-III C-methyltransferase